MDSVEPKARRTIAGIGAALLIACSPASTSAQVIDFSQIGAFESMASGTQRGGAPPKTIVEDRDGHIVFFTVLESNTEAKVYWTSLDGQPSQSNISGPGAQIFQTQGEFRVEALGSDAASVMPTCSFGCAGRSRAD